ncbi:MAG: phosphonate C-P lyase system protein PhnG [Pseudomonadota bacterium]
MQTESFSQGQRQDWIAVLSQANWPDLKLLWQSLSQKPECRILRKPETGMVMIRARMGGKGQPFNTGEATVTRCSVETVSGVNGHAYVMGRNREHALIAAEIDAGLQEPAFQKSLMENIIAPLKQIRAARLETHRRKTAATKVDFFTLVRGEDD